MIRNRLTKNLTYGIFVGALLILAGWLLDIKMLKSFHEGFVTTKPLTAISFCLVAVQIYCMSLEQDELTNRNYLFVYSSSTICLLLLISFAVLTELYEFKIGIEDIIPIETGEAIQTTEPGRPSLGTMVLFLAISVTGISSYLDAGKKNIIRMSVGVLIIAMSIVAFIGYIADIPMLYYYEPKFSTAMGVLTALLGLFSGIALLLIEHKDQ